LRRRARFLRLVWLSGAVASGHRSRSATSLRKVGIEPSKQVIAYAANLAGGFQSLSRQGATEDHSGAVLTRKHVQPSGRSGARVTMRSTSQSRVPFITLARRNCCKCTQWPGSDRRPQNDGHPSTKARSAPTHPTCPPKAYMLFTSDLTVTVITNPVEHGRKLGE